MLCLCARRFAGGGVHVAGRRAAAIPQLLAPSIPACTTSPALFAARRTRVTAASSTATKRATSSKAPARTPKKKTTAKATQAQESAVPASASEDAAIALQYQRKTPKEHVRLRPGMYIGSTKPVTETKWLWNAKKRRMVFEEVTYVPGLVKLFDEILVNAADNVHRCKHTSLISVTMDRKTNTFTVFNDGTGVPIKMHPTENMYVPSLVFGHLLTGSNFDDSAESFTGGRHGYGAKLTNIFSERFTIETADIDAGLAFKQTWERMEPVGDAEVSSLAAHVNEPTSRTKRKKVTKPKPYTRITFQPDLGVFGMTKLDKGTLDVAATRVVDLAGTLGGRVEVTLNGEPIVLPTTVPGDPARVNPFLPFARFFVPDATALVSVSPSPRFTVVAGCAPSVRGGYSVSFVNAMETSRGGTHVDFITKQIAKHVASVINNKSKANEVPRATAVTVRNELVLFINCNISNPDFDSQMKDRLTMDVDSFAQDCVLPESFLNKLTRQAGLGDRIMNVLASRSKSILHSQQSRAPVSSGRITGIPKLEDANLAGSPQHAHKCTLILTEGDSAKALAVAGLAKVGRDYFGVFPLRGKPLNVRDASTKQVADNDEMSNLCKILNLKYKQTYSVGHDQPLPGVRYGRVMLMTDQDYDGSHIKGLLINTFAHFWPNLLSRPGFLCSFVTPVIKARRSGKEDLSFYSIREYDQWRQRVADQGQDASRWHIKYYKGLGTSTSAEARQYFANLEQHTVSFVDTGKDERETLERFDMCFNKAAAEQRRGWITSSLSDTETFFDHSKSTMSYSEFIDQELVLYSQYDNQRSIPSVVDGLKPSQRKILYATLDRFGAKAVAAATAAAASAVAAAAAASTTTTTTTASPNALKGTKADSKARSGANGKGHGIQAELKVAQLAGIVSEKAAYHHGEASLHTTIIGMAQDFVGSNNLPLLFPAGQFGTRMQGGKDAASARYTYTRPQDYTRLLFPAADDALLRRNEDDGALVEPVHYVPIIPMILVNGTVGIGHGWSTAVHPRSPIDVVTAVRNMIRQREPGSSNVANDKSDASIETPLPPWFKGFTGAIAFQEGAVSTPTTGTAVYDERTHELHIHELPVGRWVDAYRTTLSSPKFKDAIDNLREYHTETKVHFALTVRPAHRSAVAALAKKPGALESWLGLSTNLRHNNMHLFTADGHIHLYDSVQEILNAYFPVRFDLYSSRKEAQLRSLSHKRDVHKNQLRFAKELVTSEIDIAGRNRDQLAQILSERDYDTMPTIDERYKDSSRDARGDGGGAANVVVAGSDVAVNVEEEGSVEAQSTSLSSLSPLAKGYSYLLSRPLSDLTDDRIDSQSKMVLSLQQSIEDLRKETPGSIWMRELGALEAHLRQLGYKASWE